MTLFESESQYREKAAIWRVFSLLPLFGGLAGGQIFRWFAINIPMDLGTGTGGTFTSDIDIFACLRPYPPRQEGDWLYRTWEVKVSLLANDGTGRSLKGGKTKKLVTQLNAYRRFGAPDVSLLDVYLCEDGFFQAHSFPPPVLAESVTKKILELGQNQFGYRLLPFQHGRDEHGDIGLMAMAEQHNPTNATISVLPASATVLHEPFSQLVARLDEFFEQCSDRPHKHFNQIVFCRACRTLQLISMKETYTCPGCSADLIVQS